MSTIDDDASSEELEVTKESENDLETEKVSDTDIGLEEYDPSGRMYSDDDEDIDENYYMTSILNERYGTGEYTS
jgi:hypothetical protein